MPDRGGKTYGGITGDVQALYEEYPYPQYRQLFVCPNAADTLAYVAHRCYWTEPFRPRRILVAGCGTTQVVALAAAYPSATVLGLDISRGSLRIAERMAADLGLTNLVLRQEDILSFSGHDGEFDLVDCYGVLHHTRDPLLGLRNLARCAAPEGLVSIMVYSQRVRHEIGEVQRVFGMLNRVREARGGNPSLEARVAFAGRLARAVADSGSRLAAAGQTALDLLRDDRTQFADTYAQPREVRYSLDEVLDLVASAGLEVVNFVQEGEWDPAAYLDDPGLLARVRSLPQEDIWRFCDVAGSPFYHFLCAHPPTAGRPARPRQCLADDALVLAMVPHPCAVHSFPLRNNRVAGPALREPREGSTFLRRGGDRIRFRGTFGQLDAPAGALDFLRLADGKRTVREIADAAATHQGTIARPGEAEVVAIFRSLFGMTAFLAPDASQCHGCPLRQEALQAAEEAR